MTDPAIIAAAYAAERNYSHNPDDVIDASGAVGAWGTAKESTSELSDLSDNGNIATIHGAMPAEGFIQGRRFDEAHDDYLDCGNLSELNNCSNLTLHVLVRRNSHNTGHRMIFATAKDSTYISFQNDVPFVSFLSDSQITLTSGYTTSINVFDLVSIVYDGVHLIIYINGVEKNRVSITGTIDTGTTNNFIGKYIVANYEFDGEIIFTTLKITPDTLNEVQVFFNTLARLPFWSVNYTDYPDNVAEYTDNLPYSSSIISSGIFKVDDDKLQCVSTGTMTYSASYEFDGSEYIKVKIDGVEYAGTGTITQGNTTVSVAQGSNKVTIQMGTGDTIEGEIGIQFREEV